MANTSTTAHQCANSVAIKPRKQQFEFNDIKSSDWFGNNPILSAYFTALSATFPPGEQEFIDSVRHYQEQIKDEKLKIQVKGFIGQEAAHRHQHHQVNEVFDRLGMNATRLEQHLGEHIKKQREKHPAKTLLAATVGMEHITAIMADHILKHPEILDPMPKPMRELFIWHAIEEVEHKAVAFEVYEACEGDKVHLNRVMKFQTLEFLIRSSCYCAAILVWRRKMPSFKEMKEAMGFFWGKNGFYKQLYKPYKAFFEKDFHPWNNDNRGLLESWQEKQPALL